MKKLVKQKGITLIALVITIILMLILLGVTVTVALNGGLFSTAKEARNRTQLELEKEQLLMEAIGALGTDGIVDFEKLDANLPEGFTKISEKTYKSKTENIFNVSDYGDITEITEDSSEGEITTYTGYSIGDEVTVGGEKFYVIEDSDETNSNVTLLAKYCLNSSGIQENISYSSLGRRFSTKSYWSNATEYPLNLNEYTIPDGVTSAITTVREYGESKGGKGRMMTYKEVSDLVGSYEGIIYGTSVGATSGYLMYWLGTALNSNTVYWVNGSGKTFSNSNMPENSMPAGIRPVIEISKDLVSSVS